MEHINHTLDQLLQIPLTVGFIFMLAGIFVLLFPPKRINSLYGYRTRNSMASQQRWDFAQQYSSKVMILTGVFLVAASTTKLFIPMNMSQQPIVGFVLLGVSVIALIGLTERAIKRQFPKSESPCL